MSCLGVADCDIFCDVIGACDDTISCTGTQCVVCDSMACTGGIDGACIPDMGSCP